MNKFNKSAKVAGEKSILSVKQESNTTKKFDAGNAETIEIVEETKDEEAKTKEKTLVNISEDIQQDELSNTREEIKREPTLQELKDRATVLFLLQENHSKLLDRRNKLDHFALSHDKQNAEIIIRDATGLEFKSSSPKTIGQFIEYCKSEFNLVIKETETNLVNAFAI